MLCEDRNCAECPATPITCAACADGYFLEANRCRQKCPDAYKTCGQTEICTAESKCEACPRSMINIGQQCLCQDGNACAASEYCDGAKCSACNADMPNCVSCSDRHNCVYCKEGYEAVDGKCQYLCGGKTCADNAVCSSGECVTCDGYLTNIDGECKCKGLTPVCLIYEYCGYFGCTLCKNAMDNCYTCKNESECTKLRNMCDDFNCLMCENDQSVCTKCPEGFELKAGECYAPCGDHAYCGSKYFCSENQTCEPCPYFMRNYGGICACGDEICTDGSFCSMSSIRYCAGCNAKMSNCKNCIDINHCIEPKGPCEVANCANCFMIASKCDKCADGYESNYYDCLQKCGKSLCFKNEICAEGRCKLCAVNEFNVAGACSCGFGAHCAKGNYCSPEGECVSCPPNCKTCNGATCYSCKHKYVLQNGVCDKYSKTAVIAGSVAGAVVILLLIAGLVYYCVKYRKQREYAMQKDAQTTNAQVTEVQQDQMYI